MKLIKRCAAAGTTAVLLALSLTACGGDDASDAPDDASVKDFCEAFNDEGDLDEDASAEEQVDAAKEQADKVIEVGTPEDMSDEEREGFEIFVDAIKDLDEDAVKDFEAAEDEGAYKDALGVDDDEFEKVTAFLTYASETCSS
jgi:hypothetical protein